MRRIRNSELVVANLCHCGKDPHCKKALSRKNTETKMRNAYEAPIPGDFDQSDTSEATRIARFVRLVTIVATFGGLLFGYDTGVINGALGYMKRDFGLTPLTEGMVTSFLLLGAAMGAVIGGHLADRYGRRTSIMTLAVTFLVGTLACTFAPTVTAMVIARFVLGLAVGGASVAVPTYLAEMAPADRRGQIVTQNELMIVSGQMLAFILNAVIGNQWGATHGIWRWMLVIATLPAVALWIGMLAMPESPRWLASKGRIGDALRVLKRVREQQNVAAELAEIRHAGAQHRQTGRRVIAELSTPWIRRVFFIGLGVAVVMQATGVNSIMYYGTQILTSSGFGRETALIANIANGVISVLATCVGIYALGKIGRRPMFILGLSGTTLSLLMIGLFSDWLPVSHLRAGLILSAMVCFLSFMQALIAPVSWVLLSELFPLRIRGFAAGVAGCTLWLVNFVIGLCFPSLVAHVGISNTFFLFAALGLVSITFITRCLPETRGRSLEAIEAWFQAGHDRSSRAAR